MRIPIALLIFSVTTLLTAVEPTDAELKNVERCVRARFDNEPSVRTHDGYLEVALEHGPLLKNKATTKVYLKQLRALPLQIHRKTYRHGLYLSSPGTITVTLPAPAKRLTAVFGVDSNRVTSFYSNANRGAVVGTVTVTAKTRYRSPLMREGMPGEKVDVDLNGVESFVLTTLGQSEGVIEQVDFNQSDWAEATVELVNGHEIRIGELPMVPCHRFNTTLPVLLITLKVQEPTKQTRRCL